MKISCESCGTQHDLDPPSWVRASGRPFRFRCSACGSSQSVSPPPEGPTEVPTERVAAPSPPRAIPSVAPPALLEEDEPVTSVRPAGLRPPTPTLTPTSTPQPAPTPDPAPLAEAQRAPVFLKQSGQIYSVRDWETLRRWIGEGRVDRTDLVSEGGVRWEPTGSRPELAALFEAPAAPAPLPLPFAGDTPFGNAEAAEVWSDDDTDGIPLGLPPLPTEEDPAPPAPLPLPPLVSDDLLDDGDAALEGVDMVSLPAPARGLYGEGLSIDDDPPPDDPLDDPWGAEPPSAPRPSVSAEALLDDSMFDDPPEVTDEREPDPGAILEGVHQAERSLHEAVTQQLPRVDPPSRPPPRAPQPGRARNGDAGGWKPPPLAVVEDEPSEDPAPAGDAYPFDAEWEAGIVRRRSGWWLWPLAAVLTGMGILATVLWIAFPPVPPVSPEPLELPAPRSTIAPEPAEVAPVPEPPGPTSIVEPPALPAPAPVVPAPAPEPAPEPARPDPARPDPEAISALRARGWKLVESDPTAAAAAFHDALALAPDDEESNYGYGYVMLMGDHRDEATTHLCRVRRAKDPEIRQDVNGMIETHALECPGR